MDISKLNINENQDINNKSKRVKNKDGIKTHIIIFIVALIMMAITEKIIGFQYNVFQNGFLDKREFLHLGIWLIVYFIAYNGYKLLNKVNKFIKGFSVKD